MTLNQWIDNGWLRKHKTSQEEIENLVMIIDRDLKDARGGISDDWRFGIAYNAALKLCTILLYAEGYKAERTLQHYRSIWSSPAQTPANIVDVNIPWKQGMSIGLLVYSGFCGDKHNIISGH